MCFLMFFVSVVEGVFIFYIFVNSSVRGWVIGGVGS